jgi:RNA polymerase sigma-70 factor (ECF subfamily)
MPKESTYNISELLRRLAEDDEQAFRLIFDHYKKIFFATTYKMTRCEVSAEEVVQEVFVALWVKRNLIAAAEEPENYLFTILHNSIYGHFRKLAKERRLKARLDQHLEESENPIEILMQEKDNRTIFEAIVNRLPPQQKLVYRLSRQEGISRHEIAEQLNLSPNTVRNHLAAATEYLRSYCKIPISEIILLFYCLHFL